MTREEALQTARETLEMLADPKFPEERKREVRENLRAMLLGACKREPGFIESETVKKILTEAGVLQD